MYRFFAQALEYQIFMKKILAALAFAFVFFGNMQAQILPPDFRCVRGDTLFWD